MSTIEGKIEQLKEIRNNIKTAINDKYNSTNPAGDCMTTYAELIRNIPQEGGEIKSKLTWRNPILNGENGEEEKNITGTADDNTIENGNEVNAGALVVLKADEVDGYNCTWDIGDDLSDLVIVDGINSNVLKFRMPNKPVTDITCSYSRAIYSVSVKCIDTQGNDLNNILGEVTIDIVNGDSTNVVGKYYYGTLLKITIPSTKFSNWEDGSDANPMEITVSGNNVLIAKYDIDLNHEIKLLECVNLFNNKSVMDAYINKITPTITKLFTKVERNCDDTNNPIYRYDTSEKGYTICVENGFELDVDGCEWFDGVNNSYKIVPEGSNIEDVIKIGLKKNNSDETVITSIVKEDVEYTVYSIKLDTEPQKIRFKINLKSE